jgi:hypothetical protein
MLLSEDCGQFAHSNHTFYFMIFDNLIISLDSEHISPSPAPRAAKGAKLIFFAGHLGDIVAVAAAPSYILSPFSFPRRFVLQPAWPSKLQAPTPPHFPFPSHPPSSRTTYALLLLALAAGKGKRVKEGGTKISAQFAPFALFSLFLNFPSFSLRPIFAETKGF